MAGESGVSVGMESNLWAVPVVLPGCVNERAPGRWAYDSRPIRARGCEGRQLEVAAWHGSAGRHGRAGRRYMPDALDAVRASH